MWLGQFNSSKDFFPIIPATANYFVTYRRRWELRYDIVGLPHGADPSLEDDVVADFRFEQSPGEFYLPICVQSFGIE